MSSSYVSLFYLVDDFPTAVQVLADAEIKCKGRVVGRWDSKTLSVIEVPFEYVLSAEILLEEAGMINREGRE